LARTICLGLPVEQLRVDTVAHNQPINPILAEPTALVALDGNDVELVENVAECDRSVAGHHSHPSTRNARSICAVAISMSDSSPVSAVFNSSSAAKSQCGRAWRNGLKRATKRAASSNVASSTPDPPVGSIVRVRASLKSYCGAIPALCTLHAPTT